MNIIGTDRSRLALLGGRPVREHPFPPYETLGPDERRAVNEVLDAGVLSGYLATWGGAFLGGPKVRELETRWAEHFGARHAVSVNSATSGIYAAVGAAGIGPGDEVVVSPYTMSASAAAVLVYGGVPIFADIDPRTYCISDVTIRAVLTRRTKAIIVVDIFGQPADFDPITRLAQEHGLVVIEDAAQAPGARYKGRWAGRLGDMGIFSLNYHKTIHSGEGGMVVTDDDALADRVRLIRNHAEAVVGEMGHDGADLVGFNYRLPELSAAIAIEQLRKLEDLTIARTDGAEFLTERWSQVPGLTPAWVQPDCRHVYYVLPVQFDPTVVGVSRKMFVQAVRAEGVPLVEGYVQPLYYQPVYQRRIMRCGPNCPRYEGDVFYEAGICPVAEEMHRERLFYTTLFHPGLSRTDLEDVAMAVEKVAAGAAGLRSVSPLG